jgi:hypothetical protein
MVLMPPFISPRPTPPKSIGRFSACLLMLFAILPGSLHGSPDQEAAARKADIEKQLAELRMRSQRIDDTDFDPDMPFATGERCASVNLFDSLPATSLAGDGVHPDAEGNLAMARVLAPALAQLLHAHPAKLDQSHHEIAGPPHKINASHRKKKTQ